MRFGTCCSQVMGLFLDIHTTKYKDNREVLWDMAVAMNTELLALRDAGCRCIQIEEPTLHFMANTFGADHENVKFMVECYNREVQDLDDVEIWIHTCWGNPNMQRVMEDTSYRASFELYLHEMRGDVWTIETRDRDFRDIELFEPLKGKLPKKICIGAVSHRNLQADRPDDVADAIRHAMKYIAPEQLIVSSDCGFGRQGCNREIAFYKASAIAQGCNIVRQELGWRAGLYSRRRSRAADRYRAENRTTSSRASLSPCPHAYADANPPFVPEGWRSGACMLGSSADAPSVRLSRRHRPGVYRGLALDDPDPGVTGNDEACQRRDRGGRREARKPLARGLSIPRCDCQPAGVETGDDGGRHRRRIGLHRATDGTAGRARRDGDRDRARPGARVVHGRTCARRRHSELLRALGMPADGSGLDAGVGRRHGRSSRHSAASNMQASC